MDACSQHYYGTTCIKILKSLGLIINIYDRRIANCIIDNNQFKIARYVNDDKVSQAEEKINTKRIIKISVHTCELLVLRGTKHKFLVMEAEFLKMEKYRFYEVLHQRIHHIIRKL